MLRTPDFCLAAGWRADMVRLLFASRGSVSLILAATFCFVSTLVPEQFVVLYFSLSVSLARTSAVKLFSPGGYSCCVAMFSLKTY